MKRKIFIGITPPSKIQDEINRILKFLKKESLASKLLPIDWAQNEKHHLVLGFLGAMTQEGLNACGQACEATASQFTPFKLRTGSISYFYRDKKKLGSLLYLDVLDPDNSLRNLYKSLALNLKDKGFSPQKRLEAHITLGLLKRQRFEHDQKRMLDELSQIELPESEDFLIEKIDIIEENHSVIKSYALANPV